MKSKILTLRDYLFALVVCTACFSVGVLAAYLSEFVALT